MQNKNKRRRDMKKVTENIGSMIIEKLFDFDNNDYELVGGVCEKENGINEPDTLSISFSFEYSTCEVGCYVYMAGGTAKVVEATLYPQNKNHKLEAIEGGVAKYLEENLDTKELWTEALDHARENSMDEYQRNGFANAADYWRYRFSA